MDKSDKIRTLLVVMPFHNIWSPNIGTSILQSTLKKAGFECDIYYANIDFAKFSGLDFSEITHNSNLLGNDYLFSNLLSRKKKPNKTCLKYNLVEKVTSYTEKFIKYAASKIVEKKYDLVGFSLIFQSIPSLVLAKKIKQLSVKTHIILGGSNCEGEMGAAIHRNFKWIDYICRGEGEETLLQLVRYLSGEKFLIRNIPGLIFRENGNSIINQAFHSCYNHLENNPVPCYDDWRNQLIKSGFDISSDQCILPFETSRGCWYGSIKQCVFCGLSGESIKYKVKDPDKSFKELEELQLKYGINNFFTTDLIFPNNYFDSFLPKLMSLSRKVSMIYEVKASITKKQLIKFKKAGINTIQPGLETLSSNLLKIMRKSTKAYQNIRVLKWAFEQGITIVWNILYGLPGELPVDYEKMVQLIPSLTHLQPPLFGIFPIVLQRFSPLYNELQENGNVKIKPLPEYNDIYDLPKKELVTLAYYFENPLNKEKDFGYVESLKFQIYKWFESIGDSVFFSINVDDYLYFYDSRVVSKREMRKIKGFEKEIYLACDKGISLNSLLKRFGKKKELLNKVLSKFVKNHMVIFIDNKYLSLAVPMDNYIHENVDAEINLAICASVYRILMKKKCKSLKKIGERNLSSVKKDQA